MPRNITPIDFRKLSDRDNDSIRYDNDGFELKLFSIDYDFNGSIYTLDVWAYSWEDAEKRLNAMKNSGKIGGQIHTRIEL